MDDARELQYGIEFETSDADGSIDQLGEGLDRLEQRIGAAEMGAQRMGAGVVSACDSGAAGADRFTGAVDRTSGAMEDMAESTRSAADTTRLFGGGLDDAEEDAEGLRAKIRETAEGAESLGAAFRETMADGLEAGQSITKSFGTGLTGAIDFSRNKVKTFVNDTVKGAQNIATKFKHPIQTIRGDLVKALRGAQDSTEDLGDEADDTTDDLQEMGAAGETAGNQVSEAIKNVVTAFVGLEAIKQGIELLKQFGASALEAYSATETTSKQFDTLFSTSAAEWVDNYSEAVHRSTSEVMGFMVQNKTMYQEMGITGEAAEELSTLTTSLAYDFGNAFSMDDAEALGLVQSAIQGDTAALSAYGVTLDETALKQSAAALGRSENIDALDDAAMAQVRLNAILDQTADVQQAAINQTGGLTNSVKSLNGVWSNFLTTAGSKFAPAIENIVGAVVDDWPTIEPMLLSFVDVLADGIGGVAPTLIELAQNLIPAVTSVLGTLVSAAGPVLSVFTDIASSALPPLVEIVESLVSYVLPPFLSTLETLNTNVIQPLIPVIQQIASQVLPVFGQAFSAAGQIIGQLASSVIPPLTQILGVLIQAIQPIISAAQSFISALLPPLMTLISAAGNILSGVILPVVSALSPVLSVIGDVLGVIGDVLGKVVGWLADGAGKVVDFFTGLFGGAKESSAAVEELGNSVTDLGAATESVKSPEIEIPEPKVPDIPAIAVPVETTPFELPDFSTDLTPLSLPITAEVPEITPPTVEAVNIPVTVETPIIPEPEVTAVELPVTVEKPVIPEPDIEPARLPVDAEKPEILTPDVSPVIIPVTVEKPVIPEADITPIVIPVTAETPIIQTPEVPTVVVPVTAEKPIIQKPDVPLVILPVVAEVPEITPPPVETVNIPVFAETPVIPEPDVSPVTIPVNLELSDLDIPTPEPITVPVNVERPVIPEPEIVMIVIPVSVQKPVIPEPDPPDMPTLTLGPADTAPFNQSMAKAAQDASDAGQASAKALQTFYENSLDNIGTVASSTFARAASDAENSWSRMVDAAREGARSIVSSFQDIGAAANKAGNTKLTISSASIPSHASGTSSFEGGWTRMNEEGGELAYLPSGTAIIPADQTDKIINDATTTNNSSTAEYTDSSTFAPQLSIVMGEGGGAVDEEALLARIRDQMEQFWREKKEEEYHKRALQGAHAR